MTALVRRVQVALTIERIREELATCDTIKELHLLGAKFRGIAHVLRAQGASRESLNALAKEKIAIDREVGARLLALRKAGKLAKRGGDRDRKRQLDPSKPQTLSELGVSKNSAKRWVEMASIPRVTVENYFRHADKEPDEEITSAGLLRAATTISGATDYDGDEACTPMGFIDMARDVMGEIDLDPATNEAAQARIKATRYFTEKGSAHPWISAHPWMGRIWLNPPYSSGKLEPFIEHLFEEFAAGRTTEAVILVNNATDTGWFQRLLVAFPVCFVKGRISFETHAGVPMPNNRYAQAFFYAGPNVNRFVEVFSEIGTVERALRPEPTASGAEAV